MLVFSEVPGNLSQLLVPDFLLLLSFQTFPKFFFFFWLFPFSLGPNGLSFSMFSVFLSVV